MKGRFAQAEVEKVREAQGAMTKTLREIQFPLHRQQNPAKRRPADPQHDGDIFGAATSEMVATAVAEVAARLTSPYGDD